MIPILEEISQIRSTKFLGPAKVLDLNNEGTLALLGLEILGEKIETWGRIMMSFSQKISFGDTVLAAGEQINEIYIIGIINSLSGQPIKARDGTFVTLDKTQNAEKIQVFSKQNELIFEYDSCSGKSRINIHSGDLEFVTGKGDISFISEGNIRFKGKQSIELESSNGIKMTVRSFIDKMQSTISLDRIKIKLGSSNLKIASKRADIYIKDSKYIGSNFSATLKQIRFIAGKIESITNDIICKTKNVYNTADELIQIKAGRIRTLVKSALHIKSKNAYLKSEEDFKINAEKIHLG
ncbi:MAG: DUF3540 domain-containing protein [Ignavibacteria bacterium]